MSRIKTIDEIEADNDRLSRIRADVWQRSERYTHTILEDEGFMLTSETAQQIIGTVCPEKLCVDCKRYYFVNDKHSAAIVGVDENNIGLFTFELPVEVTPTMVETWSLEDTLDYLKNQEVKAKRGVWLTDCVSIALAVLSILIVVAICMSPQ